VITSLIQAGRDAVGLEQIHQPLGSLIWLVVNQVFDEVAVVVPVVQQCGCFVRRIVDPLQDAAQTLTLELIEASADIGFDLLSCDLGWHFIGLGLDF